MMPSGNRDRLDGEEPIDRIGRLDAGDHELLTDLVDVTERGQLAADLDQPAERRHEGTLAQRLGEVLAAGVGHAAVHVVAVEAPQRLAHDLLVVDTGGDREHRAADGDDDEDEGDQQLDVHLTPRS